MENDLCKLCDQAKELQNSHVIGKSIFRAINKNSGKHYGIYTDQEANKVVRSTDQWATPMLCENCESLLNSRYENYSSWALRNKQPGVKHQTNLHYLSIKNVNQKRLLMYVISIFWRAAVSSHKVFKNVQIPSEINEYLKRCILGKINIDTKLFAVRITKLMDPSNYLSDVILQGIITNLMPRNVEKGSSFIMVFSGYSFEILIGCLEPCEMYEHGVLRKNKSVLHIPYQDPLSIPELFRSLKKTRDIAIRDVNSLNYIDLNQ